MQIGESAAKELSGTRRDRIAKAKADRILDAAVEVFSRSGLDGARLEQIAEAADVSKTNILYYFESKRNLYTAALTRMLELWLEPLREFDVSQDAFDALSNYIATKIRYSRSHPAASRLFAMEMLGGAPHLMHILSGSLKELVDEKSEVINTWIAQGQLAPVDPRHLFFSIWSLTQHYADFEVQVKALTGKDLSETAFEEETVKNVITLLLGGLVGRDRSNKFVRSPGYVR